jgi:SH3-like domain-containing protein
VVTRRFSGSRPVALLILACCGAAATVSCGGSSTASRDPSIGVAYVGPASMNLRQDLAVRSAPVTTVKHGDRLDILQTRRRLVRVRTADGLEGWADSRSLLSAAQMDELQSLAKDAEKFPSQGTAKVFDALNVHAEPSRTSPSFYQIPEGGAVDVLAHRVTPRVAAEPQVLSATRAHTAAKKAQAKPAKPVAQLLPLPKPPSPPSNWEQMSRPRASDLPGYVPPPPPPSPPVDDWNLVRTKDGNVGWVLARMLYMAIPDEVAQYAEGNRITAYLAIGDVKDGDKVKHNWLWTTADSSLKNAEFDSFRVFVWSTRRHRYETAYIERNVTGFYPVELADVPGSQEKGFALVMQDKDGSLYKRLYGFSGYRVRMISKTPVARDSAAFGPANRAAADAAEARQPPPSGWRQKITTRLRRWLRRL